MNRREQQFFSRQNIPIAEQGKVTEVINYLKKCTEFFTRNLNVHPRPIPESNLPDTFFDKMKEVCGIISQLQGGDETQAKKIFYYILLSASVAMAFSSQADKFDEVRSFFKRLCPVQCAEVDGELEDKHQASMMMGN